MEGDAIIETVLIALDGWQAKQISREFALEGRMSTNILPQSTQRY